MARWSDAFKVVDYHQYKSELSVPGCYEFGRVKSGSFYTLYVGESVNIYNRMKKYNSENCHSSDIYELLFLCGRQSLYMHYFQTKEHLATESRLLHRFLIKENGLYQFNRQYEYAHLPDDFDRAAFLRRINGR